MNNLNVFNNPYYLWKYPSCWWKNCKMFFRSFRYAYQRIIRGYADSDIWDLDTFYANLISSSLSFLADHCIGWPGNEEFPTPEDWKKYLKETAAKFYRSVESNEYYDTPEGNKWWNWILENKLENEWYSENNNPYIDSMMEEESDNAHKRQKDLDEGIKMLHHVWYHLWD